MLPNANLGNNDLESAFVGAVCDRERDGSRSQTAPTKTYRGLTLLTRLAIGSNYRLKL